MFMNVGGYTAPSPVWPPPPKTSPLSNLLSGMGLYLPQNFVTPQRLVYPLLSARIQIPSGWSSGPIPCASGMGSCCASCASGGTCQGHDHGMGMGQLFESTDISTWGIGEWGVIGLGGLGLLALLNAITSTGRTAAQYVGSKKSRRRAKKKAALRQQLSQL
jgi:hypothetical protein